MAYEFTAFFEDLVVGRFTDNRENDHQISKIFK